MWKGKLKDFKITIVYKIKILKKLQHSYLHAINK